MGLMLAGERDARMFREGPGQKCGGGVGVGVGVGVFRDWRVSFAWHHRPRVQDFLLPYIQVFTHVNFTILLFLVPFFL